MDEDTEPALSVDEFVEYCRIQAGLLSGRVETMGEEASQLLAEVDERVSEVRAKLEDHRPDPAGTERPASATGPDGSPVDVAELEALQDDLEEKQSLVEQTQARMEAVQELAAGYADLASELETAFDDGEAAFERVVQFEADEDAPAYFTDRKTLIEAVAESPGPEDGDDADDE